MATRSQVANAKAKTASIVNPGASSRVTPSSGFKSPTAAQQVNVKKAAAPTFGHGVITRSGNAVYKDAKLVGQYKTPGEADAAVATFTGTRSQGQVAGNVMGDNSGETYRANKMTNPGTQTGQANTHSGQGIITSPASDAISSTDEARSGRNQTRTDAADIVTSADNYLTTQPDTITSSGTAADDALSLSTDQQAFGDTEEGKKMSETLDSLYEQLANGDYTDAEKSQIEDKVKATQEQYKRLIDEAKRQKAQGMPKALIAAGQQGGLMNTQFSGIAALMSTQGGTFAGAGGELSRIQSEYDMNISNLESHQVQAMTEARSAAEEAIRTGRKEDLAIAQQRFDNAKTLNDDRNALATQKANAIYAWQSSVIEMQKYERETASATIDALVASGKTAEEIPDWYFSSLDEKSGYTNGVSKAIFEAGLSESSANNETAYLDQMNKVMNITEKLRPNESITIGGVQYYGTKSGSTFEGKEIDEATGDILMFNRDTATGEMTITRQKSVLTPNVKYNQQEIKNADGSTSLWYVPANPNDGPAIPVNGQQSGGAQGVNDGAIQQAFPAGTTYAEAVKSNPSLTPADFYCLRFIGNMDVRGDAFINAVGDTLAEKTAAVDTSITSKNAAIGDYILTNEDSRYGHIALINDIRTDPTTGKRVAVLTESNYKPLTVGHTRTIQLDGNEASNGGKVLGFLHSQLKPEYTSQGVTTQLGNPAPGSDGSKVTEALNKLPEVKEMQDNRDLRNSLLNYQNLVKDYGTSQNIKIPTAWLPFVSGDITFSLQPAQRDALKNAYAAIISDYKKAKGLGTLDAGVEKLMEGLLPNLANAGDIGQYIKAGSVINDTSKMISDMDKKAQSNYDLIVSGNPEYANSTYLNGLRDSYTEDGDSGADQEPLQYNDANDANVKEAIANGWTEEKQPDGSVIIYPPK